MSYVLEIILRLVKTQLAVGNFPNHDTKHKRLLSLARNYKRFNMLIKKQKKRLYFFERQ